MQYLLSEKIIAKINHYRIYLLWTIFLGLIVMFLYLAYQTIHLNYLPIFSDEYSYYLDAKSFWLYNRIDAASTFNESYSIIGHSGFHGFFYSIFYGSLFKLFSIVNIPPSIPLVHILMTIVLFVFLAISKIKTENKLLIGIVFISNYVFLIFISSSKTEIFHYIFAVVVAYLLYLTYERKESRYQWYLIALVFALIPFRESWVFILFGLYPLTRSFRDFLKFTLILFLGLTAVIVYQKYFQAPFPDDFFHNMMSNLDSSSVMETINLLYEHFKKNVGLYFLYETYDGYEYVFYYKYLYVLTLLYTLYTGLKNKDKSIIAAALIASVYFSSMLVLYDAFAWKEVRSMAVSFVIMAVILILRQRYLAVTLIILFQLFYINSVLSAQQGINDDRQGMNMLIDKNKVLLDKFEDLGKYTSYFDKKEILVLLDINLMPLDNSVLFYQLPLSANDKFIRYSFIYFNFDLQNSKCDIYISGRKEKIKNMKLLGHNKYFYFYRNINAK